MGIKKEDWPQIDARIDLALKGIRNDIKSLRPQGWRKIIFWLREAGILVIVIGAFVALLGITITSIYRAVTDVVEEATFRTQTKDTLTTIQKDITSIQSQLGLRVPNALKRLILPPAHSVETANLVGNLKQAGMVIDAAFQTQTPSAPEQLRPIRDSLETLRSKPEQNVEVRMIATSVLIQLDGYTEFSKEAEEQKYPTIQQPAQPSLPPQSRGFLRFTMECAHPTAGFLHMEPPELADRTYVVDVSVVGCQQDLDHIIWIHTHFKNATVRYHGGPLRLADVTFENCKFDFGDEPQSREALNALRGLNGRPAVLLIEPKPR
jgi:hypothetical protein